MRFCKEDWMVTKHQGAATAKTAGTLGEQAGSVGLATQMIEMAFQFHQAGRIRDAENAYQKALVIHPGQVDALYYLGVLYLQNGVHDAAEEFLTRALKKQPKFAEGHFNLGVALQEQGKLKESAKAYSQAIKADKRLVPAQLNLGNVYLDLKQFERAASVLSKLIKISPKSAQAHLNLGRASKCKGDEETALESYRRALELNPQYADAHLNIGAILLNRRNNDEAKEAFYRAAELNPQSFEAYNNIGVTWKRDGFLEHALTCFARASEIKPGFADAHANMGGVLYAFGDLERSEMEVRKGIELSPNSSAAHCMLGKVLRSRGKFVEAVATLNVAIKLAPDMAEPYREMGATLADNHQHEDALCAFAKAIERDPKDPISLNNSGMSHILLGRLNEGVDFFRRASDALDGFNLATSNSLFAMNYVSEISQEDLSKAHFAYGERWDRDYDDGDFANTPDPDRPLRIGYVSPDLRQHVAVYFIEEVLKAHDRKKFKIFCYAEVFKPDDVTERLQALDLTWRSTIERNNQEVAQQIKDDGIDILIDLAGHTGNNRLPVFGLKPAPVQVTWIGYPNTTGLKNVDYVMMEKNFLPKGGEVHFSEEVYFLPRVPVSYKIPPARPDPGPSPYERNGYVTFGCFNNSIKVGKAAIKAWSEVLRAVPDAKLLLKSHAYRSSIAVDASKSAFEAQGIDPDRIVCEGPSRHDEYLKRFSAIDLALDPFPYNGGTTTLETLYLGVPLLALEGATWGARIGSGLLRVVGEDSLVASSPEDYIAKAIDFARNPEKLSALRGGLYERFMATGITDHALQTRDVENAYRDMWGRWCARRNAAGTTASGAKASGSRQRSK
jgi:predicted O-linked N-acetylglucosamine transferase (SPINDLY family)